MSGFKSRADAQRPSTSALAKTNVLHSLKNTQMIAPAKVALPAELLSMIIEYLLVPDLFRFARTSRRMREMVYEDSRWVKRLKAMGVWDEREARKIWDCAVVGKDEGVDANKQTNGVKRVQANNTTLFDAGLEEERQRVSVRPTEKTSLNGFETLTLPGSQFSSSRHSELIYQDHESILDILSNIKSIRGSARQEFGRVYRALAPFYINLTSETDNDNLAIFRVYKTPEDQAKMLAQLRNFSKSDWAQECTSRKEKLDQTINMFEDKIVHEFEQGLEARDAENKMRRYAHVLNTLNGGRACVELYVQMNPILDDRNVLAHHSMDCLNHAPAGGIALEPSREFLEQLSEKLKDQVDIIDRVFPPGEDVFRALLERITQDLLIPYTTSLFDEAHERSITSYLKAISGVFEQCVQFAVTLRPSKNCKDFEDTLKTMITKIFDLHVDSYLQEEADFFRKSAEREVHDWESRLSEQEASTESFLMSNFNRQADKSDFLSSFKKVVMMPVNVLPFGASKSTSSKKQTLQPSISQTPTRSIAQHDQMCPSTDDASISDRKRLSKECGISTVMDLRTKTEHVNQVKKQKGDLSVPANLQSDSSLSEPLKIPGFKYVEININGRPFEMHLILQLGLWNILKIIFLMLFGYRNKAVMIMAQEVMNPSGLYGLAVDILLACGNELYVALSTFARQDNLPILVHCTQGKDRTGLVIMLLLLILLFPQADRDHSLRYTKDSRASIPKKSEWHTRGTRKRRTRSDGGEDGKGASTKQDENKMIAAITHDYLLSVPGLATGREALLKEIHAIGLDDSFADCDGEFVSRVVDFLMVNFGSVDLYLNGIGVDRKMREQIRENLIC